MKRTKRSFEDESKRKNSRVLNTSIYKSGLQAQLNTSLWCVGDFKINIVAGESAKLFIVLVASKRPIGHIWLMWATIEQLFWIKCAHLYGTCNINDNLFT